MINETAPESIRISGLKFEHGSNGKYEYYYHTDHAGVIWQVWRLLHGQWRANWARIIPMFGYPAEIRRAVYTTNAIKSLNMSLRKVIKTRASFPNEEAAFKLMYLALKNISKKWRMPIRD
jgi:hypothetical protein